MAYYELRYTGNDKSLGSKIFNALYRDTISDIKKTNYYNMVTYSGSTIYEIHEHIHFSRLDNKLVKATADVFTTSGDKVASMEWYNSGFDGYTKAYLYINGNRIDSIGVVESNASEFMHKSPLNPTTWFKKLKNVWGFFKAGWTFDNYRIYDSDGDFVFEWNGDKKIEMDFDPGTNNFFRVLLFVMSNHQSPHK